MANEIKDIGDIIKKCKILLLDVEGTTTSISFVKDKLFLYAEENVKKFLEEEWEKEAVKEVVVALRKLAVEDQENKVEGVVTIPGEDESKDDQITGLVDSVKWQMSTDRKVGPLKLLQGLIWEQGYTNGDIKGHVYDDVAAALEQWRSMEGQKVYIYSSGSVQAQKLLFGQSLAGDLLPHIDGHFDTAVGAKLEATSYTIIAEKIGVKPEEILFLTDLVKEAEAARAAGMYSALVSREGNAPLSAEAAAAYPVIQSFAQLATSNKRKPDPQVEEETPAKVLKTDVEKDVKESVETLAATAPAAPEEASAEAPAAAPAPPEEAKEEEKMEVDAENATSTEAPVETAKENVTKVITEIEEITDSNEPVDAPMVDVEPIVEEENKTEESKKETENDAPIVNDDKTEPEPKETKTQASDSEPVAQKTPVVEEMVIEEVTNDKTSPTAPDAVDEPVPVIEEPSIAEEMEELQNVGEVLEKECNEILSKVQDVTNLDSITVKPMLNSIAEETMETENLDSNDIVDRILETELELESKQKEVINSAKNEEEKPTIGENGTAKEEHVNKEENGFDGVTADVNVKSNTNDENNKPQEVLTEVNTEENSAMESKCEEKQELVQEPLAPESKESPTQKNATNEAADKSKESNGEDKKPVEESKAVPESAEDSKSVEESRSVEESKTIEEKPLEDSTPVTESNATESNTSDEHKSAEMSKSEGNSSEPQVNGKANGDSSSLNGDASKEEKLCSRLAVENGKEVTENGSNGNSMETEQSQGDCKVEEIADIKVKTVAAVEPSTDPIDQPMEA